VAGAHNLAAASSGGIERLPSLPEEAFFSIAPDWVCEVLSPSTERIDRGRKLRVYAKAGVAHAWLEDATAVQAEPFGDIAFDLGRLWADSPPIPPARG
jgi:hypothetical protein